MTDPMFLFTALVAAVAGTFDRCRPAPLARRDCGAVSIEQVLRWVHAYPGNDCILIEGVGRNERGRLIVLNPAYTIVE